MYEVNRNLTHRLVQPASAPEEKLFQFIDLTDDRGWDELESALPEGSADDVTGKVV